MDRFSDHIAMLIERGGYVMVPLLALSVISLTLIVERVWFWAATNRPGRLRQLGKLNEALRRGNGPVAEALVVDDRSPYALVATELLEHGATDAVALEAVEQQRPRLERFMVTLSTIVTAAPLLGILGTVVGIIQSFRLLGEQTTLTDPREVAGGIAAALLTTALGLIVALMTLFPYMVFRSQAGRALGRMESVIAAAQQGMFVGSTPKPQTAPRLKMAVATAGSADAPKDSDTDSPADEALPMETASGSAGAS